MTSVVRMKLEEMIDQLKSHGYTCIKTERLETIHMTQTVDRYHATNIQEAEVLQMKERSMEQCMGGEIAKQLRGKLRFTKDHPSRSGLGFYDTYRARLTIVKPEEEPGGS